ncbi:hypothetical protein REMIM1_PD00308 (plasmid) [Rhizobium etli bv. mimosae str. Mim1]|nr:hypothetical protein REMIM1_PD00308 [Rhizobium etli bv. mimosae str. Mim1]
MQFLNWDRRGAAPHPPAGTFSPFRRGEGGCAAPSSSHSNISLGKSLSRHDGGERVRVRGRHIRRQSKITA